MNRPTMNAADGTNIGKWGMVSVYFYMRAQANSVGRSPDVNFISQRRFVLALRLETTG
jgi:hypothetical protein